MSKGLWTMTSQATRYEYDPENPTGVSKESVLMGGNLTWARNANLYGGAENNSGFTNINSVGSNKWYYRTNVNIGYYF